MGKILRGCFFLILFADNYTLMKIVYSFIIVILLGCIILTGKYNYLYYAGVMIGSMFFLNRQKAFNKLPNYSIFNAVFIGYLAFIVVNRTRSFKFSHFTEGCINIAEHGFFALVICLKLLVYLHLFTSFSFRKKAIFAALLFNAIGFLNEIFQNWLCKRSLLFFIEDARKDMIVNLLGSLLFLLFINFAIRNTKKTI
jgi:hypothetical protein